MLPRTDEYSSDLTHNSSLGGCCGVDIYQWCLTGLTRLGGVQTVYSCVHIQNLFKESVAKSRGLSPGSGFLSVADMSVTVTKGDVKLQ